jgi:radical SAM superfamily enzyme YgiQ (UPF0313 family)
LRILLVSPWDKRHGRYRSFLSFLIAYKPLTIPTLAALVPPELDATVDVCDELSDKISKHDEHYDIVAISFISAESDRAYGFAEMFQSRGSHVVLGGYHVLFNPDEAAQHADTVILGPAEVTWPMFLRDFSAGNAKPRYDVVQPSADDYVNPKRDVLSKRKYVDLPTMIASPTCRRECSFCAICKMWEAKSRRIDAVIADMKTQKRKYFIFYDPNFFDDRDYAIALMSAMKELHISWAGAACIDVADDDELLELAKESGCAGLLVGLETLNTNALADANKRFNKPEEYKSAIGKLQSYGISVNGCFVLGLDGDTEENLKNIPAQVDYLGLNLARFSLMTPVPGSELYKLYKAEGRILTEDWGDYTQNCVVVQPKDLSPERLSEIYFRVWKETYTWRRVLKRAFAVKTSSFYERMVCLLCNIGFKFIGKDM